MIIFLALATAAFNLECTLSDESDGGSKTPLIYSVDIRAKQWCARPSCVVRDLGMSDTSLKLGDFEVDRRSGKGVVTSKYQNFDLKYGLSCKPSRFTPFPTKKF